MASLVKLSGIKVEEVSGLAAGRAAALRKGGILSVADLLLHVPRRYLDRSRVEPIALAPVGEEVTDRRPGNRRSVSAVPGPKW